MLRQRKWNRKRDSGQQPLPAVDGGGSEDDALLGSRKPEPLSHSKETAVTNMSSLLRKQPVWLLLAIASGSCAAFNGVFAKL
jgi:hypothetical protein